MAFKLISFIYIIFFDLAHASKPSLTVGLPNQMDNPTPIHTTSAQERYLLALVYEPLFELDAQSNIRPVLAKSAEETSPGIARITIVENHRFSDGTPVTADEVIQSLRTICSGLTVGVQSLKSIPNCGLKNKKIDVKKINATTIELKIKSSFNYFLYELASPILYIFKKDFTQFLGSSKYKAINTQTNLFELERVWGDGIAHLSFRYVPENQIIESLNNASVLFAPLYKSATFNNFTNKKLNTINSATYVSEILVLNPAIEKNLPSGTLNLIKNEIMVSDLIACEVGLLHASSVVPEGIGGHTSFVSNIETRTVMPSKRQIKIKLHQFIDRKNNCINRKLIDIFLKHGIQAEFVDRSDYAQLVAQYGSESIDGYIEYFIFSRDASRFYERFTPHTSQPFFYAQSKDIDTKLQNAAKLDDIYARFSVYRDITRLIDQKAHIIPLAYFGHKGFINKCIHLPSNEKTELSNPNTISLLKNIKSMDCKEIQK